MFSPGPLILLAFSLLNSVHAAICINPESGASIVVPETGANLTTLCTLLAGEEIVPQCSLTSPCADGSCCNSNGQCGYETLHCGATAATTCLSNCDAIKPTAFCGKNAPLGQQHCPLNLCCSSGGYCGTTELHCVNSDPVGLTQPCQVGFGSCEIAKTPSCGTAVSPGNTASNGRKVAYYQVANLNRKCQTVLPSQINTAGLTHLIFAFASIQPQTYEVVAGNNDTSLYPQFTALKSAKLETWISIGGGSFSEPGPTFTTWSDLVSTQTNRATFISSLVTFLEKWGFQGVDIDWENPVLPARGGKPADTQNLVLLVQEMKAAFGSKYGISMALPNDIGYLDKFDPVAMEPYLTFVNFMTYDIHGPWEAPTLGAIIQPQSSIKDVEKASVPMWFSGFSPSKINLGMALYGRGYATTNSSCQEIGCPYTALSTPGRCTSDAGVLSLTEIKEIIKQKNLVPELLPVDMIKQITYEDQWMGYDDEETMALKTRWADQHCLGGSVAWSIDFLTDPGIAPANSTSPTPSTDLTTSTTGSCGGGLTCNGSIWGNCCSANSYCGNTEAYCGAGCQKAFGTCEVATLTPASNSIVTTSTII